jgi:hypothetical protein
MIMALELVNYGRKQSWFTGDIILAFNQGY